MKTKGWFFTIAFIAVIVVLLVQFHQPKIRGELPSSKPDMYEFIKDNLVTGGPPKDGIPAIDNPVYVSAEIAEQLGYVSSGETVFGVDIAGEVKAYPNSIMYWHEIVNEEFGGEKVSITYCPLTGSVIGYKGRNLGVSGALYNSNLVMYDRATDSLIPQILGSGIDGDLRGENLEKVHVFVTSWEQWKGEHPDTLVLSRETGHKRDYDRSPYPGYDDLLRVWFPLAAQSDLFSTKKWVFGVEHNGAYLAVPKEEFSVAGEDVVSLGGELLTLAYEDDLDVLLVNDGDIPAIQMYWFAWYAYHPDTEVWR